MDILRGAQTRYQIGYHVVWGVKYHKLLLNAARKEVLVEIIRQVCEAYNYHFVCVGVAPNHVHLFVGAPPKVAPAEVVKTVKSITARELFERFPEVRRQLYGGEFWKDGYYLGTIGEGQTEAIIRRYIAKQELTAGTVASKARQLKLWL